MLTRREFIKVSTVAGAVLWVNPWGTLEALAAEGSTPRLKKWLDPLPSVLPGLTPDTTTYPGIDYYQIAMGGGSHKFHSQLGFAPTYAYGGAPYLGPTIVATRGRPVKVAWTNNLPTRHPLRHSIDPTVPDPVDYPGLPLARAVPHLHGGFTPPQFDGHPHQWFTPSGETGPHYVAKTFDYPNAQRAAMLWYHDHAFGITRLNAYAGLAAFYIIRDSVDTGIPGLGLNLPKGDYEVPIVIQDKTFNRNGSMFYPKTGNTAIHPVWVPEFFGDTPVCNGKAYPFLAVEPRRYRLRLLNGSQARFYNLSLTVNGRDLPLHIIGTEAGLLPASVTRTHILLAPGERSDIIVDFKHVDRHAAVTLKNDAKAPYPDGSPEVPMIENIMQFRVTKRLNGADTSTSPAHLALPAIARLTLPAPGPLWREIVLKENADPATDEPVEVLINNKYFKAPVDETPSVGSTEVWQFINLTGDAHPMHTHLVQFQVVNRQPLDSDGYTEDWLDYLEGGPKPVLADYLTGESVPPPRHERGWKETVKAYPGEVTRIIAKFDLPPGVSAPAEYVYHCHILEHEENEMMRPFVVT